MSEQQQPPQVEEESKKRASDGELESERPEKRSKDKDGEEFIAEYFAEDDEKERARIEMHAWISACDPRLLYVTGKLGSGDALYGWGKHAVPVDFIHSEYCTGAEARTFYRAQTIPDVLSLDTQICAGICSVTILHTLAALWSRWPRECYFSYEQQVLFHVLRHHLDMANNDRRRADLLARLMELANAQLEKRESVERNSLIDVPAFAYNLLATLYYSNVHLIIERSDADAAAEKPGRAHFVLACENCKSEKYGFADLVRANLFPHSAPYMSQAPDALQPVAQQALSAVVNEFNSFLVSRAINKSGWICGVPRESVLRIRGEIKTVYTWDK